jgi:hypothetical protein
MISAEIRWFWQATCPPLVESWFRRGGITPGGGNINKPRRDRYLRQEGNMLLGIKVRDAVEGKRLDVEIKGLISRLEPITVGTTSVRPELWCKWKSTPLVASFEIVTDKVRWLRKFAYSGCALTELKLLENEKPEIGQDLPDDGCNIELTRVIVDGAPDIWWTLCFEAFGDLDTAPAALVKTVLATKPPLGSEGTLLSYPRWLDRFSSNRVQRDLA